MKTFETFLTEGKWIDVGADVSIIERPLPEQLVTIYKVHKSVRILYDPAGDNWIAWDGADMVHYDMARFVDPSLSMSILLADDRGDMIISGTDGTRINESAKIKIMKTSMFRAISQAAASLNTNISWVPPWGGDPPWYNT